MYFYVLAGLYVFTVETLKFTGKTGKRIIMYGYRKYTDRKYLKYQQQFHQ